MKLGLGTVQFGQAYGVSNTSGQVSRAQVGAILDRAAGAGMRVLDTAANYGEAEAVLASFDLSRFRVISKTTGLSNGLDVVLARVRQSAATLGPFDTLLVHFTRDLLGEDGARFWAQLQALRDEGLYRRIGIVVYGRCFAHGVRKHTLPASAEYITHCCVRNNSFCKTWGALNLAAIRARRNLYLESPCASR